MLVPNCPGAKLSGAKLSYHHSSGRGGVTVKLGAFSEWGGAGQSWKFSGPGRGGAGRRGVCIPVANSLTPQRQTSRVRFQISPLQIVGGNNCTQFDLFRKSAPLFISLIFAKSPWRLLLFAVNKCFPFWQPSRVDTVGSIDHFRRSDEPSKTTKAR